MPTILKKRIFNQRGITLIELIAVILIIGIIAAVGIPVVFNQISSAEDATDVANAAIVAGAVERYALMNNHYPIKGGTYAATTGTVTTVADLFTLLKAATGVYGGPYLRADFPESAKDGIWVLDGGANNNDPIYGIKK